MAEPEPKAYRFHSRICSEKPYDIQAASCRLKSGRLAFRPSPRDAICCYTKTVAQYPGKWILTLSGELKLLGEYDFLTGEKGTQCNEVGIGFLLIGHCPRATSSHGLDRSPSEGHPSNPKDPNGPPTVPNAGLRVSGVSQIEGCYHFYIIWIYKLGFPRTP